MTKLTIVHDRVYKNGVLHNKGGLTFVFDKDQVVRYADNGDCIVRVGLSRCNPVDNFNRKIARNIATGRIKDMYFEPLVDNKYVTMVDDYELVASIEEDRVTFIGSHKLRKGELKLKDVPVNNRF